MIPFHPSCVEYLSKSFKMSVEFRIHCVYSVSLSSVKTWMVRTYDIPYKSRISLWLLELNQMEFSGIMQISNYSFIIQNIVCIFANFIDLIC